MPELITEPITDNDVTAAKVNEWVARELFDLLDVRMGSMEYWYSPTSHGWKPSPDPPACKQSYAALVYRSGKKVHNALLGQVDEWLQVPDYLTDANADAEVREMVSEKLAGQYINFAFAIWKLCGGEFDVFGYPPSIVLTRVLRGYKTGHAAIAAYANGNNLDPLDVERMVRSGA